MDSELVSWLKKQVESFTRYGHEWGIQPMGYCQGAVRAFEDVIRHVNETTMGMAWASELSYEEPDDVEYWFPVLVFNKDR